MHDIPHVTRRELISFDGWGLGFFNITNEVVLLWVAAGLAVGLAALGTGIGLGFVGAKSVDAVARQSAEKGTIRQFLLIAAAFIEALCRYALLISFFLIGKGGEATKAAEKARGRPFPSS